MCKIVQKNDNYINTIIANCHTNVISGIIMGNKTVNIRISKKTAEWIDELIEQGYYNSRSEALREFVREAVE